MKYRDEAVGLKSCKYTLKITIYVNMLNLGQLRENLIFCQLLHNHVNSSSNPKSLLHMCDTYDCDYLHHIKFQLIRFSVKYRFPFPILHFFIVKSPIALLKDRFLKKMLLKTAKTRRLFFAELYAQIDLLLKLKTIFVFFFKIARFEFNVAVNYSLRSKCTQLWPPKFVWDNNFWQWQVKCS